MGKLLKNKKVLITIIIVVLLIAVGILAYLTTNYKQNMKEEGNKTAITAKDVIKDESFGGLRFTNTTLIKDNDQYILSMDVINTAQEDINVEQVNIVFKDKKGNTIVTLLGYIGGTMKVNETKTITSAVAANSVDLSKATSKTIEEYK